MATMTYEPQCGEDIATACRTAQDMAERGACSVQFTFNEVTVTATPGTTVTLLRSQWDAGMCAASAAYWTPERRAEVAENEIRDRLQLGLHLQSLESLDWSSPQLVCEWLCEFERLKFIHTPSDSGALIATFRRNGYAANVFTAAEGETTAHWSARLTTDEKWRYIIGQCLDCIAKVGSPHGLVHTFTERLRRGDM